MNYYETLYIVHPALESGRLKDIILSIQKMIESKDIKILSTDVWGKKKLAYLIDKQQYGSYVLVQLHSNGSNINKINSELEHNPDVLSYLTSRIEESNLIKDGRTLDEQILGTKASSDTNSEVETKESAPEEPSEESKSEPTEVSKESEVESDESNEPEVSEDDSKKENNEELTSEDEDGSNE
ncbi:MAG: 30S ribosomal protein S6 [Candidatus Marinimicrobia bacterium]|nr:30S ribosomal protein S6 [Candidatus Neomarinimicrobiota bacterium]